MVYVRMVRVKNLTCSTYKTSWTHITWLTKKNDISLGASRPFSSYTNFTILGKSVKETWLRIEHKVDLPLNLTYYNHTHTPTIKCVVYITYYIQFVLFEWWSIQTAYSSCIRKFWSLVHYQRYVALAVNSTNVGAVTQHQIGYMVMASMARKKRTIKVWLIIENLNLPWHQPTVQTRKLRPQLHPLPCWLQLSQYNRCATEPSCHLHNYHNNDGIYTDEDHQFQVGKVHHILQNTEYSQTHNNDMKRQELIPGYTIQSPPKSVTVIIWYTTLTVPSTVKKKLSRCLVLDPNRTLVLQHYALTFIKAII